MQQEALLFSGAPGSPYTRKMLAYLRYRHIAYRFIVSTSGRADLPKPKVGLLPTFYLRDADGELTAEVDSTPLIARFEQQFSGRAAIPSDPALAFANALVEDYADEWMTKAMFHYRWFYPDDIERSGEILPRWRDISAEESVVQTLKAQFQERQISRLYVVGSNEVTAPVIEASYERFLEVFRAMLEARPFCFGERPSSADFALAGQLSQLAKFDPTPMAVTLDRAPRVYAWGDLVDDLSGLDVQEGEGWLDRDQAASHLRPLLSEIGRVYAPFLVANGKALEAGADKVETEIDGKPWTQIPFPYQGKCWMALRSQYANLAEDDRAAVDTMLSGTGCEVLFG